jgi:hypothetical protein
MHKDIGAYNKKQEKEFKKICVALAKEIDKGLKGSESKIWHGGPVWFIDGNPIAGYWVRKNSVQLLFWSGQSFDLPDLTPEGKFKAAQVHYEKLADIKLAPLRKWLKASKKIQWDYKNIVKNRGVLNRIDI